MRLNETDSDTIINTIASCSCEFKGSKENIEEWIENIKSTSDSLAIYWAARGACSFCHTGMNVLIDRAREAYKKDYEKHWEQFSL